MDTRFLSLDLALNFQAGEEESEGPNDIENLEAQEEVDLEPLVQDRETVTVTLDQVARPGAMVSGTVTFSDGMKALWLIDEMGRPSIDPDQPGYQPSEADLVTFQAELKGLLDGQI
jgi:hypothetical protein